MVTVVWSVVVVLMLEVIGLSCSRNDNVVFRDLNFNLTQGAALHIRAGNGVGKTTLLKIIAGLLQPTSGSAQTNCTKIYLGHTHNLHPALSPHDNLKFLAAIHGCNHSLAPENLMAALSFADLTAQQHMPCAELSAGQCQRVNIARLYLSNAKLWLLDEPFTNLDVESYTRLNNLCSKHLNAGGLLVLATHSVTEILTYPFTTLYLDQYV